MPSGSSLSGHGGADFFLVSSFVKAVASNNPGLVFTGIKDSLRSHKLVFAAERSRVRSTIESVDIWPVFQLQNFPVWLWISK